MRERRNTWDLLTISAIIISLLFAPVPQLVRADPPPPQLYARFAVVTVSEQEGAELTDGTLTPDAMKDILLALRDRATLSTIDEAVELLDGTRSSGQGIPAPMGPDGQPLAPPIRLPNGPNNQLNPWVPKDGTPARPVKWVPKYPLPSPEGGQPNSSWDPVDGHWDLKDGRGGTTRWLPDGTSIGPNHKPTAKPELPPAPFDGLDLAPYVETVIWGIIIIIIIIIIASNPATAPALLLASVAAAG